MAAPVFLRAGLTTMRLFVATAAVALLAGCPSTFENLPPPGQLYFPTGIAHLSSSGSSNGVLVVANANFDKRYASGSIVAFDLDKVAGLPAFGQSVDGGAVQLTNLSVQEGAAVQIASFSGELAVLNLGPDRARIFVPTRSEGMNLNAADLDLPAAPGDAPKLRCFGSTAAEPKTNCAATAPGLSPKEFETSATGVPRAPAPYGVAVGPRACGSNDECGEGRTCTSGTCRAASGDVFGDVYVTHLAQADSPLASQQNLRGYLVHLESDALTVAEQSFINMGSGAGNSAAVGKNWVYVSGRYLSTGPNLLRLVNRDGAVLSTGLEQSYRVGESRGLALGTGEKRVFLAGRLPDSLLVMTVDDPAKAAPILYVVRAVALPASPNEVRVISRPGRGDLVAITCTSAGVLVLYDDDVGDVVAQISGVGLQPFGLAVDQRGTGARLFVSNFSDGRVAVIDVPDVNRPQDARLVAHLGEQQLCLTQLAGTSLCAAVAP